MAPLPQAPPSQSSDSTSPPKPHPFQPKPTTTHQYVPSHLSSHSHPSTNPNVPLPTIPPMSYSTSVPSTSCSSPHASSRPLSQSDVPKPPSTLQGSRPAHQQCEAADAKASDRMQGGGIQADQKQKLCSLKQEGEHSPSLPPESISGTEVTSNGSSCGELVGKMFDPDREGGAGFAPSHLALGGQVFSAARPFIDVKVQSSEPTPQIASLAAKAEQIDERFLIQTLADMVGERMQHVQASQGATSDTTLPSDIESALRLVGLGTAGDVPRTLARASASSLEQLLEAEGEPSTGQSHQNKGLTKQKLKKGATGTQLQSQKPPRAQDQVRRPKPKSQAKVNPGSEVQAARGVGLARSRKRAAAKVIGSVNKGVHEVIQKMEHVALPVTLKKHVTGQASAQKESASEMVSASVTISATSQPQAHIKHQVREDSAAGQCEGEVGSYTGALASQQHAADLLSPGGSSTQQQGHCWVPQVEQEPAEAHPQPDMHSSAPVGPQYASSTISTPRYSDSILLARVDQLPFQSDAVRSIVATMQAQASPSLSHTTQTSLQVSEYLASLASQQRLQHRALNSASFGAPFPHSSSLVTTAFTDGGMSPTDASGQNQQAYSNVRAQQAGMQRKAPAFERVSAMVDGEVKQEPGVAPTASDVGLRGVLSRDALSLELSMLADTSRASLLGAQTGSLSPAAPHARSALLQQDVGITTTGGIPNQQALQQPVLTAGRALPVRQEQGEAVAATLSTSSVTDASQLQTALEAHVDSLARQEAAMQPPAAANFTDTSVTSVPHTLLDALEGRLRSWTEASSQLAKLEGLGADLRTLPDTHSDVDQCSVLDTAQTAQYALTTPFLQTNEVKANQIASSTAKQLVLQQGQQVQAQPATQQELCLPAQTQLSEASSSLAPPKAATHSSPLNSAGDTHQLHCNELGRRPFTASQQDGGEIPDFASKRRELLTSIENIRLGIECSAASLHESLKGASALPELTSAQGLPAGDGVGLNTQETNPASSMVSHAHRAQGQQQSSQNGAESAQLQGWKEIWGVMGGASSYQPATSQDTIGKTQAGLVDSYRGQLQSNTQQMEQTAVVGEQSPRAQSPQPTRATTGSAGEERGNEATFESTYSQLLSSLPSRVELASLRSPEGTPKAAAAGTSARHRQGWTDEVHSEHQGAQEGDRAEKLGVSRHFAGIASGVRSPLRGTARVEQGSDGGALVGADGRAGEEAAEAGTEVQGAVDEILERLRAQEELGWAVLDSIDQDQVAGGEGGGRVAQSINVGKRPHDRQKEEGSGGGWWSFQLTKVPTSSHTMLGEGAAPAIQLSSPASHLGQHTSGSRASHQHTLPSVTLQRRPPPSPRSHQLAHAAPASPSSNPQKKQSAHRPQAPPPRSPPHLGDAHKKPHAADKVQPSVVAKEDSFLSASASRMAADILSDATSYSSASPGWTRRSTQGASPQFKGWRSGESVAVDCESRQAQHHAGSPCQVDQASQPSQSVKSRPQHRPTPAFHNVAAQHHAVHHDHDATLSAVRQTSEPASVVAINTAPPARQASPRPYLRVAAAQIEAVGEQRKPAAASTGSQREAAAQSRPRSGGSAIPGTSLQHSSCRESALAASPPTPHDQQHASGGESGGYAGVQLERLKLRSKRESSRELGQVQATAMESDCSWKALAQHAMDTRAISNTESSPSINQSSPPGGRQAHRSPTHAGRQAVRPPWPEINVLQDRGVGGDGVPAAGEVGSAHASELQKPSAAHELRAGNAPQGMQSDVAWAPPVDQSTREGGATVVGGTKRQSPHSRARAKPRLYGHPPSAELAGGLMRHAADALDPHTSPAAQRTAALETPPASPADARGARTTAHLEQESAVVPSSSIMHPAFDYSASPAAHGEHGSTWVSAVNRHSQRSCDADEVAVCQEEESSLTLQLQPGQHTRAQGPSVRQQHHSTASSQSQQGPLKGRKSPIRLAAPIAAQELPAFAQASFDCRPAVMTLETPEGSVRSTATQQACQAPQSPTLPSASSLVSEDRMPLAMQRKPSASPSRAHTQQTARGCQQGSDEASNGGGNRLVSLHKASPADSHKTAVTHSDVSYANTSRLAADLANSPTSESKASLQQGVVCNAPASEGQAAVAGNSTGHGRATALEGERRQRRMPRLHADFNAAAWVAAGSRPSKSTIVQRTGLDAEEKVHSRDVQAKGRPLTPPNAADASCDALTSERWETGKIGVGQLGLMPLDVTGHGENVTSMHGSIQRNGREARVILGRLDIAGAVGDIEINKPSFANSLAKQQGNQIGEGKDSSQSVESVNQCVRPQGRSSTPAISSWPCSVNGSEQSDDAKNLHRNQEGSNVQYESSFQFHRVHTSSAEGTPW